MLPESVTQQDLRRARALQESLEDLMADLAVRIAAGAHIEPGELALLGTRIVRSEAKRESDRFELFRRLLDADDVRFFSTNARLAANFRRARAKIFLTEIRTLRTEVAQVYRSRRQRIAEAGKWASLGSLLRQTAFAYAALSVLSVHGRLFYWNLPLEAGLVRSGNVVYRYLSFESLALNSAG